jgi:ureidoacrylate peracid hydrolase
MAKSKVLRDIKDILDPGHTALIVVDMQNDCCDTNGIFAKAGRDVSSLLATVPKIKSLLEVCRKKNIFIVHLQQITLPQGKSDEDAWLAFKTRDGKSPEYCLLGSWGAQFVKELEPLKDEVVIQKFRPSGFHGTFLDQVLRANGIRTVLICGNTTEGCVMATVLDASFHGYYTCIVEDATASIAKSIAFFK